MKQPRVYGKRCSQNSLMLLELYKGPEWDSLVEANGKEVNNLIIIC